MSQQITNAFEQYWQSCLTNQQPVVLDEFILADIPNLDITSPIDPDTGLPPQSQIVHRQNVDQRGRINNNAVAYTIVMDTTVGDFSFNAMYLRNKQNGVIGMIVYKGRETKLKTDQTTGQTGNSLVKSMLMGYDQAAEATLTHVDAGTWQIDYAARLRGMDEDLRQLASQLYGHHTFIGDGFKVVEKDGAYQVTQGVAIVGGLRVELKAPEVIHPGTKPIGVWVDVHRAGSLLSEHQNHFTIITSVADLTDHVDGSGYQHYVAKLATVQEDNTVVDCRGYTGNGEASIHEALSRLDKTTVVLDIYSREAMRRIHAEEGRNLVPGSFNAGSTVNNPNDVLLDEETGVAYYWVGDYPVGGYVVPPNSCPTDSNWLPATKSMTFKTVAEMMASTLHAVGDTVRWQGYYEQSDGGSNWGIVKSGTHTADGGSIFSLGETMYVEANLKGKSVNVRKFGAKGKRVYDGTYDDTAAIMRVINSSYGDVKFPDGEYAITTMTWSVSNKRIAFAGNAYLRGVSTEPVEQLLDLCNFRQSEIENLQVTFDGDAEIPVFMPNYGCAVRITSDNRAAPSQFFTIDGLFIKYIKCGLVSGNLPGQEPQASFAQSEIFIRNYKVRGVMQQLYQNAINSYITTSGCVYSTQKFEATSWWNDGMCWNLRCDVTIGAVVSEGDEFQAARIGGYNIYGTNISISNPVFEQSCTNLLTGTVKIRNIVNGYFGNDSLPLFTVSPGSKGRLLLSDADFRRPGGTASSSRSVLVNGIGSPDYQVDIVDSTIKEFAYIANAADALLVLGCNVTYRNTVIDNSESPVSSWKLNNAPVPNLGFDSHGASMPQVIDTAAKGGWTFTGDKGGFGFQTAGAPAGKAGFIRITTVGSSASVSTPSGLNAMRVCGGKDLTVGAQLKRLGSVSNFTLQVRFYDYAGATISTVTAFAADFARLTSNGFDNWQPFKVAVKVPESAVYAQLILAPGTTCDIGVTAFILNQ